MLVMIVRAMMPRISSIIAAPRIALPERVFSFPSSFNVSTVILTDVAVRITPINTFCKNRLQLASESITPGRLNTLATANPPISGTITPISAITNAFFPLFFSSSISVSNPAQNISTITPISARLCMKSVSVSIPNAAGPRIRPARSAPTTCGIRIRWVARPKIFVLKRMIARLSKNLYESIISPPAHTIYVYICLFFHTLHYTLFTHLFKAF